MTSASNDGVARGAVHEFRTASAGSAQAAICRRSTEHLRQFYRHDDNLKTAATRKISPPRSHVLAIAMLRCNTINILAITLSIQRQIVRLWHILAEHLCRDWTTHRNNLVCAPRKRGWKGCHGKE
jgi:hypothetical protein